MQTLLIVLMAGCALAAAVHIGRGIWSRSRSVERHQQALHTWPRFTAPDRRRPGGARRGRRPPGPRAGNRGERAPPGRCPRRPAPPREGTLPGPARPSPFRRPSHFEPSAAAMDAVATCRPGSPPVRWRNRPERTALDEATLPGMPPLRLEGPATRPVPIIQPQVFYFDDGPPGTARLAARRRGRPDGRRAGARRSAGRLVPSGCRRPLAVAAAARWCGRGRSAGVAAGRRSPGFELAQPPRRAPVPPTVPCSPSARSAASSVPATTTAPTPPPTVTCHHGPAPAGRVPVRQRRDCHLSIDLVGGLDHGQGNRAVLDRGKGGRPCRPAGLRGHSRAGTGLSTVTGPAWIRLGDPPHVAVSVNGTPMTVPGAAAAVPLDLQFTLG